MHKNLISKDITQRFAIGTTKLGMPYGAINPQQVEDDIAERIFIKSSALGFDSFDTAPSYGNAEQLIGKYLVPELRKVCVTKLVKIEENQINDQTLHLVEDHFQESLQNMQTHTCYGLLVHDVQDLFKPGADFLVDWMQELKAKGRVNKIGVSVYTPEEAQILYEKFEFDLIQLPCNIFDQRFIQSGTLKLLADKGVEIHARSLFLKGLILKPQVTANLPQALLLHNAAFHQEIHKQKILAYDACISFAKKQSLVDRWVIGVSSEQQLEQLVHANTDIALNFDEWVFKDVATLDPRSW